MTAKHNDGKAQWLQRTMTAKRNDRKERWLQENNDCNKAMTAKNRPLQRAVLGGSLARKLRFHESFVFTSSTCRFWRKSRTKASMAQLQLANFEGNSHECFVFTSSTRRFWRTRARKLSFAQLQLAGFEKEVSHENFVFISLQQARSGGQNVPHHRPEPCQPIVAQIPVFSYYLIPNSISFSITYSTTYSYCLIPITCVFAVKVGLLSPCVQKHRAKKIIFSSLANAWAPFTWENTGNRN